jgi:hypothetical protein
MGGVVRAALLRVEERALEMDAEDPRPRRKGHLGGPAQGLGQDRDRRGDERRQEAGHAGLRQAPDHRLPAGLVGVDQVMPEEAVDLQVDQARGEQPAGQGDVRVGQDAFAQFGDQAAGDPDPALRDTAAHKQAIGHDDGH